MRMLSRDSFYVPEVEVLRGVQAWLEADYQLRFEKFAALVASSSLPSVSVSSDEQQQLKGHITMTNAPLCSSVARKVQLTGHTLFPSTRSNSSESLFSSASTSDSVASGGMSIQLPLIISHPSISILFPNWASSPVST